MAGQPILKLPGYELLEVLHHSDTSFVYRARRLTDGKSVVVKRSVGASVSPRQFTRYRNEFELLRATDAEGVVKAHDLVRHDGQMALVLEDFPGGSLKRWLLAGDAALDERLEIAVQLAHIIGQVHAADIVHKDINPHNVLYDPVAKRCKLIDFGVATRLKSEESAFRYPAALEGTLAYMAPEQTGRMNRNVDCRADLYALGVTCYELLTGSLPHDGNADPLETIHFHIAGRAVAPCDRDGRIPGRLSDVVMKLMQKAPEQRYQSCAGVEADLRRCLEALRVGGPIPDFPLAEHDVFDRFEPPQKLYGRDAEKTALVGAFERVAQGGVETVLVSGPAGIGKTALVQELLEPITRRRGYFASGKFDPLRRDVPLSGLVSALQGLVQQLLTESEESVAGWKEAIERAVGANGRLITDLVPAVELIIGPQPPVRHLDSNEERNRFNLAFQRFIQVFGHKDHPLVLFLDDVQWADPASLVLISLVLSARDTESLLLVQAYRDNDAQAAHPLSMAVEDQRRRGVAVVDVRLDALAAEDIAQLVADALRRDRRGAMPLAEIVGVKTGGNPFFVRQFLQMLHVDGLIVFDRAANAFRYDEAAIGAASITENVVELLTAKLEKLSPETRRVLQLAAAIGYRFDLDALASIYEHSIASAAHHLHQALAAGLIVPRSELESLEAGELEAPLVYRRYSFLHDRVRQVAYAAIPEADLPRLHLALGRALLASSDNGELENRVFDIVNHMNRGAALTEGAERLRLVELNLSAGAKAKLSTAYALSARCYRQAAELLGKEAWKDRYALCYETHARLAESLWLKSDFEGAFDVLEEAVSHAAADVDKAKLYTQKTAVHLSMGDMPEALACGRRAAKLVRVDLPESGEPIERMLQAEVEAILRRTSDIGIENLLDRPVMQDEEKSAAMALLTHCLPAAYQSDQQLFALICCRMVSLSLEHGNCPLSARAYGSFAALLSSVLGSYRDAYRFAKLGVDLCHRFDDAAVLSAAYFLWAMFASHWNRPIDESVELFRQSVQYGLQSGDHQHAGYSAARRISHLQFRGMPLAELRREAKETLELLEGIGDATNLDFLPPRIRLMDWLRGERPNGDALGVGNLDERQTTAAIKARGNRSFESDWFTLLVMQRYLRGDFEAAYAFSLEAEASLAYSAGFVTRVEHTFYHSLTLAALCDGSPTGRRETLLEALAGNERLLRGWSRSCPENFSHMHLLVAAEIERLRGARLEAMNLYDRAITAASEQGFVNVEALGAELAARFWFVESKPDFGRLYLQRALHAYEIWGADGKASDLRAAYGEGAVRSAQTTKTAASTTGTSTDRADALDLATVLKASQAISREIVLDRLLATMLDIILENAGAESGSLILESDGEFLVQARKDVADGSASVLADVPLGRCESVSAGIVYYVVRTHEHVVLSDPAEGGNFRNDRYVRERRPKSVLCVPIVHKGNLTGVLYLENNHVSGAFTPNRLEALNILLSQIAVSIENAQLYAGQAEQKRAIENANVELTKEVAERKRAEREIRRYRDHLEELVKERTAELENAQGRLVDLSRRAGMAEVAAGVLHNVGNVMNSVNVGASVTRDAIRKLGVERLAAVCDLLDGHSVALAEYIAADPTGRKIPAYLRKLADALIEDKQSVLSKVDQVLEHLEHMKKIIGAQQSYAKATGVVEVCTLAEIAETAIAISEAALRNSAIDIVREYQELPPVSVDRHQIMQILVNLISNAKHALEASESADRRMILRIGVDDEGKARIEVEDNGIGIPAENLTKIFNHGFTTKRKGHGFGLHNCANAARQMHGSLTGVSDGPGRGAKFLLRVPVEYATHPVPSLARGEAAAERTSG